MSRIATSQTDTVIVAVALVTLTIFFQSPGMAAFIHWGRHQFARTTGPTTRSDNPHFALPANVAALAESRMDERTRRATFRRMLRKQIAAILRARVPALPAEAARDLAVVVLQLMKAANALSDEEALPGRAAAQRELQALTVQYLKHHLPA
jgi:hypothetical protein